MRRIPPPSTRKIRPVMRDNKASYYQMHVYDQERQRLEAERAELLKRMDLIGERVQVLRIELQKLEKTLKEKL